ncbi:MAG: hypothetical protein ACRD3O_13890 [Terriglobia bacterium]
MRDKPKTKKRGRVQRVIKSPYPSQPEIAQIEVEGAQDLYKEIRIENTLEDKKGHKVKMNEQAAVDVIIEADPESTTPK